MQIGVVFPQNEFHGDHVAVRDFAQTAEGLGFSHILAYDHILGANPDRPGGWRGPYTYEDPFLEPFVLFSYMAGVTRQIGFASGIIILPQRETALVAKQAATLDVLCNGRFRMGVGIGWNEVEYAAMHQDFHTRGKRIEAQITLMRRLWTEPLIDVHDQWHTIDDAGILPMPVQGSIPIWFGGHADAVLERTARMGDGWLPNYRTADEAAVPLAKLDGYLAVAGRTHADLGIEPRLHYGQGNVAEWRALVDGWRTAGASHMTLLTMRCGFVSIGAHLAALESFAAQMQLRS